MYMEYKVIDGALYYRTSPHEEFELCSLEQAVDYYESKLTFEKEKSERLRRENSECRSALDQIRSFMYDTVSSENAFFVALDMMKIAHKVLLEQDDDEAERE